ncbi:MAG TPA: type VII secretion system-associated protein [Pseudonocardiaceae bacterium]
MNAQRPTPPAITPEMRERARSQPNSWLLVVDPAYDLSGGIPGTAVIGRYRVDGNGEITGDFIPNASYRPLTSAASPAEAPAASVPPAAATDSTPSASSAPAAADSAPTATADSASGDSAAAESASTGSTGSTSTGSAADSAPTGTTEGARPAPSGTRIRLAADQREQVQTPPITEEMRRAARQQPNTWIHVIDPFFDNTDDVPPWGVIGAYQVDDKGEIIEKFERNPDYRPSPKALNLAEPANELEAALQLVATGYAPTETLRDKILAAELIVIAEPGREGLFVPVLPDGRGRLQAFTSESFLPGNWNSWQRIPGRWLAQGLNGVDLQLNVGSPVSAVIPCEELAGHAPAEGKTTPAPSTPTKVTGLISPGGQRTLDTPNTDPRSTASATAPQPQEHEDRPTPAADATGAAPEEQASKDDAPTPEQAAPTPEQAAPADTAQTDTAPGDDDTDAEPPAPQEKAEQPVWPEEDAQPGPRAEQPTPEQNAGAGTPVWPTEEPPEEATPAEATASQAAPQADTAPSTPAPTGIDSAGQTAPEENTSTASEETRASEEKPEPRHPDAAPASDTEARSAAPDTATDTGTAPGDAPTTDTAKAEAPAESGTPAPATTQPAAPPEQRATSEPVTSSEQQGEVPATSNGTPLGPPERFVASMVLGAVGDALGAGIEFLSLKQIQEHHGEEGLTDYVRSSEGLGEITDDTQMMLFTLEGLIRANVARRRGRPADPLLVVQHAYQRWLYTQDVLSPRTRWADSGGPFAQQAAEPDGWLVKVQQLHALRAPGSTCLSALRTFASTGRIATFTNRANNSKGCGGVMRAAPVAIWSTDPAEVFRLAAATAALTHGHPSGYLPAGVLAVLVHQLMRAVPLADAVQQTRTLLVGWKDHEEQLRALDAAVELAAEGRPTPDRLAERLGGGWVGEEALAIGLCAALATDNPRDALLVAVNHSGDSDSTGIVCGNLVGAMYGLNGIPESWLTDLELREVVQELAQDALLEFGPNPPTTDEWLQRYPAW